VAPATERDRAATRADDDRQASGQVPHQSKIAAVLGLVAALCSLAMGQARTTKLRPTQSTIEETSLKSAPSFVQTMIRWGDRFAEAEKESLFGSLPLGRL